MAITRSVPVSSDQPVGRGIGRIVFDETPSGTKSRKAAKPVRKEPGINWLAWIVCGLAVAVLCVGATASIVHVVNRPVVVPLPKNVTTERPGDTNWYQRMNGQYQHWVMKPDGSFEYVGAVEAGRDPNFSDRKSNAATADQRRKALRDAANGTASQ
ncbi:hypothetical protein [Chthonobacter albigriseus]|uniref:hypothetical protein n=1 Tax=Chthonobacter albigriseus TaxID=1683161 RepID=UPI0015EE7F9F|nr:hypothetical protein [Chthonobacter albigriseus]